MPIPFFGALMAPWLSADAVDWGRLEEAAELTLTQEQRDDLLKALNNFLADSVRQSSSPSVKALREWLNDSKGLAQTLASHLTAPSPEAETALALTIRWELPNQDLLGRLRDDLYLLSLRLQAVLNETAEPHEPGRPERWALPRLIRSSHAIYTKAGGRGLGCYRYPAHKRAGEQYAGRFLELLDVALRHAAAIIVWQERRAQQRGPSRVSPTKRRQALQQLHTSIRVSRVTLAKTIIRTLGKNA
jgi:hypothetical protein